MGTGGGAGGVTSEKGGVFLPEIISWRGKLCKETTLCGAGEKIECVYK